MATPKRAKKCIIMELSLTNPQTVRLLAKGWMSMHTPRDSGGDSPSTKVSNLVIYCLFIDENLTVLILLTVGKL